MLQLLLDNPLLLLFVVAAVGYPLGRLKIGGSSLGVAAVLFVGLAIGSLHPDLKLPEIIYVLGLVLFVYTVGLSSGPGFFASLRRKGWRDNLLVLGVLLVAAALTLVLYRLLRLPAALTAGLFAGSLTNTPALAAVLEYLKSTATASGLSPAAVDQLLAEPVIGYSMAYPVGVVGMIVALALAQRWWRVDYARESEHLEAAYAATAHHRLHSRTLRVTRPEAAGRTIQELMTANQWDVVFGRLKRGEQLALASKETRLALGDQLTVIGALDELARAAAGLGEVSQEQLELDRTELDYRRVFVSNPRVAGHRLRDLNLPQQFGAVVTRIRRGDVEFLPHGDTVLELGDRVRVLTHRSHIEAVSAFFGDSYRALSEVDIMTFSLGLGLGIILGLLPIPLPGGLTLKLGLAGGPLVVALVLGTRGRTGPLVWSLPYSANLTLRQTGLILFLAGVGTRAGYPFVTTLAQGGGWLLLAAGALITMVTAVLTLWIGHRLLRIPMGLLIGMLAGLQTQPAVLGFALEQSGNELPNVGYATVYPVATIAKILLAQIILSLLL